MKTNNAMQHFFDMNNPDTHLALIIGVATGIGKLLYGSVLANVNIVGDLEALIMAVLCAFAGMAGKYFFSLLLKKFKKNKR